MKEKEINYVFVYAHEEEKMYFDTHVVSKHQSILHKVLYIKYDPNEVKQNVEIIKKLSKLLNIFISPLEDAIWEYLKCFEKLVDEDRVYLLNVTETYQYVLNWKTEFITGYSHKNADLTSLRNDYGVNIRYCIDNVFEEAV